MSLIIESHSLTRTHTDVTMFRTTAKNWDRGSSGAGSGSAPFCLLRSETQQGSESQHTPEPAPRSEPQQGSEPQRPLRSPQHHATPQRGSAHLRTKYLLTIYTQKGIITI